MLRGRMRALWIGRLSDDPPNRQAYQAPERDRQRKARDDAFDRSEIVPNTIMDRGVFRGIVRCDFERGGIAQEGDEILG